MGTWVFSLQSESGAGREQGAAGRPSLVPEVGAGSPPPFQEMETSGRISDLPARGVGIHGVQMMSQALGLALHWALSLRDQPLWAAGPPHQEPLISKCHGGSRGLARGSELPWGQSCSGNTGRGVLGADLGVRSAGGGGSGGRPGPSSSSCDGGRSPRSPPTEGSGPLIAPAP